MRIEYKVHHKEKDRYALVYGTDSDTNEEVLLLQAVVVPVDGKRYAIAAPANPARMADDKFLTKALKALKSRYTSKEGVADLIYEEDAKIDVMKEQIYVSSRFIVERYELNMSI